MNFKNLEVIDFRIESFSVFSENVIIDLSGDGVRSFFNGIEFILKYTDKKKFLKKLSLLHIDKWKKEYMPNGKTVCDGVNWSIEFVYNDDTVKEISGYSEYPKNFNKFLTIVGLEKI